AGLSSGRIGFVGPAQEANALKKKSGGPEGPGGIAPGYGGRRPGLRPEVDASVAPQTPEGAAPPLPDSAGAGHDRAAAPRSGLLSEDLPQAASGPSGSGPRSAVPLHR